MRARLLLAALLAAGLFAVPADASAQAWIRDPGDAYLQLGYRFFTANTLFDSDGNRQPIARFQQHALSFYGEVGVIDRWLQLTVDGDFFRRNVLPGQGAVTGLGDLRVAAWTGLLEDPFRLSFGVQLGLPTGDASPSAGPNADGVAEITARSLPTGDGETDVTFQMAAGYGGRVSGTSLELYTQGVLGYAVRTNDFTDQIVYRAEGGARIAEPGWDRFQLLVRISGRELLGDPAQIAGVAGVGDGISYTQISPELIGRIHGGLAASVAFDVPVRGTNLPAGYAFRTALSYTLDASEL